MGSVEHPLSTLSIDGSLTSDGETSTEKSTNKKGSKGAGGGSGGTVLLFLRALALGESAILSSVGGHGNPNGSGGGGGGRIHFHWSDIPTGDGYQPIASVRGGIETGGGLGSGIDGAGENGTITGKTCPRGLYGIFCEECPLGTSKNVSGSDRTLCHNCPANELPRRAIHIAVRGGVAETPCPYKCISDRYHIATLLHGPGRVNIHLWWTLVIWYSSHGPLDLVSSGA